MLLFDEHLVNMWNEYLGEVLNQRVRILHDNMRF